MQTATTALPTTRDLMRLGFSQDEIQALEALKASHDPYREYCESNREFEQISFLKWRVERGEFARA